MSNPNALPLTQVLEQNSMLTHLRARLADSQRRFEVIRPLLPQGCINDIKHCPASEHEWTLLVSSPAVAAKLRQWKPELEDALAKQGWIGQTIHIKVQNSRSGLTQNGHN
jgi:hypothetical protein